MFAVMAFAYVYTLYDLFAAYAFKKYMFASTEIKNPFSCV